MSDRYKNEPFNTPEQKSYEKALNKIRELESQLTEKEALLKEAIKEIKDLESDNQSLAHLVESLTAQLKQRDEVLRDVADVVNSVISSIDNGEYRSAMFILEAFINKHEQITKEIL